LAGKVTIDLDAIIPKRDEERVVTLGGREFNVSDIPVGVAAAYMRIRTDPTYLLSDAMIDGSVSMLNQKLPDGEKVDRAWFLGVVDGATLEAITDVILSPFYDRRSSIKKPKPAKIQATEEQLKTD
jgi:hypothetical protein